ncbi:MAG TPA: cobalamin-binding protein, partial [Desulfobacteraceae bacterium]|nr:cobalamin-binding protein [Desulfobacteraceae bacterium]
MDPAKTAELLKQLHDAVVDMDEEKTPRLCQEALAAGIDAYTAIMEGLAAGMDTVGRF